MNIFQYLFFLGIIQVLYSFIFQWTSLLLALILVLLKLDKLGGYILKIINYYLYVSLLSILTLTALNGVNSIPYFLLLIGTGLFFVFITIGGGMYEKQKEAQQNFDYYAIEMMKYDPYFLFGALGFFIVVLFIPLLGNTLPVQMLFILIDWVYKLPIIGFLVGIYGMFTVFGTLFQAFIMGGAGTYLILSKLRGKKETKENSPDISQQENIIEVSEPIIPQQDSVLVAEYQNDRDELYSQAIEFLSGKDDVRAEGLQKKFNIGYSRAERIIQHLIEDGYAAVNDQNNQNSSIFPNKETEKQGMMITETLKAFGIQTRINEANIKKNGIEYCLDVAVGSPIQEIVNREMDIAAAVASPTGKVKIQAPIPGRTQVGITVPIKE